MNKQSTVDFQGSENTLWASQVALVVKNLPANAEMLVRPLGWEDSLEEDMATHSSVLAWKIPKNEGAWRATVHSVAESDMIEVNEHSTCQTL